MIKADVNNGVVNAELEGTKSEILADLSVFALSVFDKLEEATGLPKEYHQMIFMLGMKMHNKHHD